MCEHILFQMFYECLLNYVRLSQLCCDFFSCTLIFPFLQLRKIGEAQYVSKFPSVSDFTNNTHHECMGDKVWLSVQRQLHFILSCDRSSLVYGGVTGHRCLLLLHTLQQVLFARDDDLEHEINLLTKVHLHLYCDLTLTSCLNSLRITEVTQYLMGL